MKISLKDWPKVYRKLEGLRLTQDERIQFARASAATPDERWEMNGNCIKALGLGEPVRSLRDLERRKAKLRRLESPRLWRLRLSNRELMRGQMYGASLVEEAL